MDQGSIPTKAALTEPGALWLSRPPFLLFARVIEAPPPGFPVDFLYELLDRNGSTLLPDLKGRLDADWWYCYQPLTRRYG